MCRCLCLRDVCAVLWWTVAGVQTRRLGPYKKNYWGSGGNLLELGGIFSGEFGRNCAETLCANQVVVANLQVVVANQQAVLAKVQMFCGEFAMRLCSSVVGGSEVSDATTWTI